MVIDWRQLGGGFLYVLGMLAIGYWAMKKTKTLDDYLIGGRNIPAPVVGLSYAATAASSAHMVGAVGTMYSSGWGYGGPYTFFVLWCTLINFLVIGPRFCVVTKRLDCLTVPDYIGERYDSNRARILAAIITFILLAVYSGSVMMGTARYLEAAAGVPYVAGLIGTALIIGLYTTAGGYVASAYTDFVQSILMIVALALVSIIGIVRIGGFNQYLVSLSAVDKQLVSFPGVSPQVLALSLVWGIAALGQPQLAARFMSIDEPKKITNAMMWATTAYMLLAITGIFAGTVGRVIFPVEFVKTPDLLSGNLIVELFPGILPIIFLGGFLGASMSTIDSVVIVAAGNIARDLYQKGFKKEADDKTIMRLCQIFTVLLLLLGAILVIRPGTIMILLTALAFGGLGILYLPQVVFGLFWNRGTAQGSIASMIGGIVVMFIWHFMGNPIIHNFVPGLLTALVLYVVVSLLSPKLPEEHLNRVMP